MTINGFIKFLCLVVLLIVGYVTFSTPANLKKFEYQLLSQPGNNDFFDNFEQAKNTRELFPTDFSRWHQLTLQNNEAKIFQQPTKNCFILWAECISGFGENTVELTDEKFKRGKQSLKFTAQPVVPDLGRQSKAGIRRHLFNFEEDTDLYFSGWFYLEGEKNENFTRQLNFMGIRSASRSWRYRKEPGRFFLFDFNNYIASDLLNWVPKPDIYRQEVLEEVPFPFQKWTNIRVHIKFSHTTDGLVEVWQNGKKIMYRPGQTLPEKKTKFSILELGILGHQDLQNPQALYIDEIQISDEPFFKL